MLLKMKIEIKNWYTGEEIKEITNKSIRTIDRRRKEFIEKGINTDWFKTKRKPFKYKFEFLGEFLSLSMFDILNKNKQMMRTINCLKNNNSIEQHLSLFDWNYFITIAYAETLNKKQCFDHMHKFYEEINSLSKGKINRMFFTTENFTNRKGYHNHFALKSSLDIDFIETLMHLKLPYGRIDIKKYDPYLAGIFYIAKEGIQGENWDLLGNKLESEANKIFPKQL